MDKQALELELQQVIKTVVDYPKPGIIFRDVTSLMQDGPSFKKVIDAFCHFYADKGITKIVGTESRGFIFGAPLAYALGISFVPVRKPGKLPRERISQAYTLEYGEAVVEIHDDALQAGEKVLIVDDLLATGGTARAVVDLVEHQRQPAGDRRRTGADVACLVVKAKLHRVRAEQPERYRVLHAQVLSYPEAIGEQRFAALDAALDAEQQLLFRQQQEVAIEPKAFALLLYLCGIAAKSNNLRGGLLSITYIYQQP